MIVTLAQLRQTNRNEQDRGVTVGRNSESIIERYIDEQQQAGRFIRDTEDDAAFSPKQKR